MRIDLMRDRSSQFPEIENKGKCVQLRIWNCKFKSLKPIAEFSNLEELVIASLPDNSLEFLRALKKLRYLKILHMPKIKNLNGIEALTKLESLSLATSPSWDSSGKVLTVETLDPISELKNLKHIELLGVVPKNKSLAALENCAKLKTAKFTKYSASEISRFQSVTGVKDEFNPGSSFERG